MKNSSRHLVSRNRRVTRKPRSKAGKGKLIQDQSAKHLILDESEVEIIIKALFVACQNLHSGAEEAMALKIGIDCLWTMIIDYYDSSKDELDRWVIDNIGFNVHEASYSTLKTGKLVVGNGFDEEGGSDDEDHECYEESDFDDEDDTPSRSIQ